MSIVNGHPHWVSRGQPLSVPTLWNKKGLPPTDPTRGAPLTKQASSSLTQRKAAKIAQFKILVLLERLKCLVAST